MRSSIQYGRRLLLVCLWLVVCAAAQDRTCPGEPGVLYEVSLAKRAQHLVGVKVFFRSSTTTRDFQLPVWNALYQVRDFAQFVGKVEARDEAGELLPVQKVDKTTWRVEGDGSCATLTYDVFADEAGPFSSQFNDEHAFLNWAQILMYAVDDRGGNIALRMKDVPSGWKVRDGGVLGGFDPQTEPGKTARIKGYDRLVDSPLEAGTFQEIAFRDSGATYHVVIHAAPGDVNTDELTSALRKITAAATEWMQDRPYQDYTFIYHLPHGPAAGGMEHANSTAIDASAQSPATAIAAVTAHEFFHLWNVKRIRPQSLEPIDYTKENYSRALWFSEGVTSTVQEHLLFRAGLLDERQFLDRLARQIGALEQRPAHKTQSVEESSLDTWFEKYGFYRRPERSVSYYNKGQIVGVLLDLKMREISHGQRSLRDLFQYLNETYAKQGTLFPDSLGVQMAAETLTGGSFEEFFEQYVSGTGDLPYRELFRTVGLELSMHHVSGAYAGFTVSRAIGTQPVVALVDEDGPARDAGLVAGDTIEEVNGAPVVGNPMQQISKMKPGEVLRLKLRARSGARREVKITLAAKSSQEYALQDVADITEPMRARRAAWLRAESEPESHP